MSEFKFGKKSLERLALCDERIQKLCQEMIRRSDFDLTITCGFRNEEDQNKAYNDKKSQVKWPNSKHNKFPSHAVDICPYPINWDKNDIRWHKMIALAYEVARIQGIKIRSGKFFAFEDFPHIELVEEKKQ